MAQMRNTKTIFYLPYKPDPLKPSASQLRPLRMLEALKKLGEVKIVWGKRRERVECIEIVKRRILDGERYDFCYGEFSTFPLSYRAYKGFPFINLRDFLFFAFLRKHNIQVGLFYRDVYWNSKAYEFMGNKERAKARRYIPYYYIDLLFCRLLGIHIFVPSLRMQPYLPIISANLISQLPSGLEEIGKTKHVFSHDSDDLHIIYIGGIDTNHYDIRMMFEVVKLNKGLRLSCCFRENEWNEIKNAYEQYLCDRIDIYHCFGKDLERIYEDADVFCLFIRPVRYWEFAMPFKMFESLGHDVPVFAVENTAVGDFVVENSIGWAIPYSMSKAVELLEYLRSHRNEIDVMCTMAQVAKTKNSWESRALEIMEILGNHAK